MTWNHNFSCMAITSHIIYSPRGIAKLLISHFIYGDKREVGLGLYYFPYLPSKNVYFWSDGALLLLFFPMGALSIPSVAKWIN